MHLFALSSFGISQPIYSLLENNATFFVVRDVTAWQIFLVLFTYNVFIPIVLYLIYNLLKKTNLKLSIYSLSLIVFTLSILLLLPIIKKTGVESSFELLILSIIISVAFVFLYRFHMSKTFLVYVAVLAMVFPVSGQPAFTIT